MRRPVLLTEQTTARILEMLTSNIGTPMVPAPSTSTALPPIAETLRLLHTPGARSKPYIVWLRSDVIRHPFIPRRVSPRPLQASAHTRSGTLSSGACLLSLSLYLTNLVLALYSPSYCFTHLCCPVQHPSNRKANSSCRPPSSPLLLCIPLPRPRVRRSRRGSSRTRSRRCRRCGATIRGSAYSSFHSLLIPGADVMLDLVLVGFRPCRRSVAAGRWWCTCNPP
jgi:hypothetical protein